MKNNNCSNSKRKARSKTKRKEVKTTILDESWQKRIFVNFVMHFLNSVSLSLFLSLPLLLFPIQLQIMDVCQCKIAEERNFSLANPTKKNTYIFTSY